MEDSQSDLDHQTMQLAGDPRRMATGLFKGVDFQVWETVLAWMRLAPNELLFVEGAEDFDIVSGTDGVTVQTKATSAPLTLRSEPAITALTNFWRNKAANPQKSVQLRFVTTSRVGCEDGRTVAGLDVWMACRRRADREQIEDIRTFLLIHRSGHFARVEAASDLRAFLESATAEQVHKELIVPVSWECEAPGVDDIREEVRRQLHVFGQQHGLLPRDSDRALSALFVRVAHTAFREHRALAAADLLVEFDEATREAVPKVELNLLRAQVTEFHLTRADPAVTEAGRDKGPHADFPISIREPLDEANKLTHAGRYADARLQLDLAMRVAEEEKSESAIFECRIDLAENRILAQRDVDVARRDLWTCLPQAANARQKQSVLTLLGDAEVFIGNIAEGKSAYRDAYEIAKSHRDRFGEARLLSSLAHASELLGDLAEAHKLLDQGTELSRAEYREALSDRKVASAINLASCMASKACLLRHEAKLPEAVGHLTRAEPLFEEVGSLDNLARTKLMRGEILFNDARWTEGLAVVEEARATFESIGNTEWECRCLDSMAKLFATLEDDARAVSCLDKAVNLSESTGGNSAPYLLNLAKLARKHDDSDAAMALVERARAAAVTASDDEVVAECLIGQARLTPRQDRSGREEVLRSAIAHFRAALNKCEIKGRRAVILTRIGNLLGEVGEIYEAEQSFRSALVLFEEIGDIRGMGDCLGSLSGIAREKDSPADALSALERVIQLCEDKPLHHLHAGALHDLGMLTLSQGQVGAARKHLDRAKAIADKHQLKDVLEVLGESLERLQDAEQFRRPPERDFDALIRELHAWCSEFPAARESILPLWYYVHRAELWSICRSLLGVKFLICAPDAITFAETAEAFRAQGDLFVYGRGFALRTERRTDIIPWSEKLLIPPHIKVAFFKSAPSPEQTHKALLRALRDEVYVLVPFDDSVQGLFGTRIIAYGRKMRLPDEIETLMLGTSADELLANKRICLPLGERKTPDILHIMLVALENGMVPLFLRRLPGGDRVVSECDVSFEVSRAPSAGPATDATRAARELWLRLIACDGVRTSLSQLAEEFTALARSMETNSIQVRVFFLRFRAGEQEVVHPAVVMRT